MGTRTDPDYYRTQYEIMTSRPIIDKVIETLNLASGCPSWTAPPTGAHVLGRAHVEPKRNTRLVLVRFDSSDPALAAEVANALAASTCKTTSTSS